MIFLILGSMASIENKMLAISQSDTRMWEDEFSGASGIHLSLPNDLGVFTASTNDTYNSHLQSADDPDNRGAFNSGKAIRKCYDKIRFRCLIIGRANAGKTTILQRVCNTTEEPVIFRSNASWLNCMEELERVSF